MYDLLHILSQISIDTLCISNLSCSNYLCGSNYLKVLEVIFNRKILIRLCAYFGFVLNPTKHV